MEPAFLRRRLLVAALLAGAFFLARDMLLRPHTQGTLPREMAGCRVNLNTAPPEEIAALPAIGPRMAQTIVEARARAGKPWRTLDDLSGIKGLGPATRAKIEPFVRF